MNPKQIIATILGVSLFITIMFGLLAYAFKAKPAWMGFDDGKTKENIQVVKRDTVYLEPSVQITEKRLSELNRDASQKDILIAEKDSIAKKAKILNDTLNMYKSKIAYFLDSISKVHKNLGDTKGKTTFLEDSIKKIVSKYKVVEEKLKLAENKIKDQESFISKKQDTGEKKSFGDFAKIYNNANPKDVAKILEQLDERDAAAILKLMQKKKAGKIIESMKPQTAAAILLLSNAD